MNKISYSILLFFSVAIISCKQKDRSSQMIAELNPTDTFLLELPQRKGVVDTFFYNKYLRFQKSVNLDYLERGFDSIQIRLFYGGAMVGQRMVVLTNKNKKWSAEISKVTDSLNPNYNEEGDYRYSENYISYRTIEYKAPKSGWDKFIRKFFNLNVLTLPDERKVTGIDLASGPMDGWGITVEIATKKVYRCYGYSNPDYFYRKSEEARNINHILVLVDEEFGLKHVGDYIDEMPNEESWEVVAGDSSSNIEIQEVQLQEIKPERKKKKSKNN